MHDKIFTGNPAALRQPERLKLLEIDRVVQISALEAGLRSVLDVGTGTGVWADAFSKAKLQAEGVDVSREMLKIAAQHLPDIKFHLASAESLPFPDKSFDLVFMGLLLHETDNRANAMREAARVARKRVAILEWPMDIRQAGPPLNHRIPDDEIRKLAQNNSFVSLRVNHLSALVLYTLDLVSHNI